MIYLIISILCSVTVGVLLKLFKRYDVIFSQALAWNYLTAVLLAGFIFKPGPTTDGEPEWLYIFLGTLLPIVFFFLNKSVASQGLARTDIAQRLSLLIPLIAAWVIFNEVFTTTKLVALGIGLIGVSLVLRRPASENAEKKNWLFPLLVFLGFGIIDVLFKQVARINVVPYTSALYHILLFAFIFASTRVFSDLLVIPKGGKRQRLTLKSAIGGVLLGAFNFANILFYLKAHKHFSENPSTVFAGMNLGVIVLGSLIGILVFKEKFSKLNYAGMALALVAVALIAIAQRYAI